MCGDVPKQLTAIQADASLVKSIPDNYLAGYLALYAAKNCDTKFLKVIKLIQTMVKVAKKFAPLRPIAILIKPVLSVAREALELEIELLDRTLKSMVKSKLQAVLMAAGCASIAAELTKVQERYKRVGPSSGLYLRPVLTAPYGFFVLHPPLPSSTWFHVAYATILSHIL